MSREPKQIEPNDVVVARVKELPTAFFASAAQEISRDHTSLDCCPI